MKTTFKLFTISLFAAIVTGCGKDPVTPALTKEEQVAKYLTGTGNKIWHLKAIKVNNVPQNFNSAYTKTYNMVFPQTTQGKFADFDNYFGDWTMKGATAMQEVFQQIGGGGFGMRDYTIISVSETTLNMYYVASNTKVEELYNAY
jgi:hypothetical protein